jgi:hypothetical protein
MTIKPLAIAALLLISKIGTGQNVSNLKLDNKLSILNDKVFFLFPTEAKNVARQGDIMSADPNANIETRIIHDIDKQRLVFFARELFVTSNKKLLEKISNDNKETATCKLLTDRDSLLSVLATPKQYDSTQNAILVNNLYVRTQDNTVLVIGAYINPEAFKNKNEYQVLSEKVFSTIQKGSRTVNYKARTETLPILEGKKKFSIPLPEGFIVTKDKKYDFEVLNFKKVEDISDTSWVSLTIYIGHHPSYFYNEYNFDESNSEKIKGSFLGKPVEWLSFKNTEQQFYLKEQKIQSPTIEEELIIHIAMLGNNQKGIDELTKLIEKVKLIE